MKKTCYLYTALLLCLLTACGGRGNNGLSPVGGPQAQTEEQAASKGPQSMQDSDITVPVTVGTTEYQSNVVRRPDQSLPIVTNDQGQRFVDNRITLTLRQGTRQVVSRTFTKADFTPYLDAGFQRHAILEGLVFDKVEGSRLLYAASVAYPESDLYIPFQITVTTGGSISIAKSDIMDEYEATPDSISQ